MAGLQDIAPMVAKRWVTSAVAAPMRAAALAASQPAWPPPMTMTSNDSCAGIMKPTSTAITQKPEDVSRETSQVHRPPKIRGRTSGAADVSRETSSRRVAVQLMAGTKEYYLPIQN